MAMGLQLPDAAGLARGISGTAPEVHPGSAALVRGGKVLDSVWSRAAERSRCRLAATQPEVPGQDEFGPEVDEERAIHVPEKVGGCALVCAARDLRWAARLERRRSSSG